MPPIDKADGREIAPLVASLALTLVLVFPRVELLPIGGSALRVDDLLLLIVAAALGRQWLTALGSRRFLPLLALAALSSVSALLAALLGPGQGLLTGLLVAVRPLEYTVMFAAGLTLRSHPRLLMRSVVVGVIANSIYVAFQFGSGTALSRVSGLTGGPYELAAIMAGCALFLIGRRRIGWGSLAAALVLASAARVTAAAFIAVLGTAAITGRFLPATGTQTRRTAAGGLIVLIVVTLVTPVGGVLVNRVAEISLLGGWEESEVAAYGLAPDTPAELARMTETQVRRTIESLPAGSDPSATLRFARWRLLARSVDSPSEVGLGVGPGFGGLAVDGQYVRTLFETGVLGAAAFAWLLFSEWRFTRSSPSVRAYLVVLLITAAFIDIFVAYKPMALYWTLTGFVLREVRPTAARSHWRSSTHEPANSELPS